MISSLESERLTLIPLTLEQLKTYLVDRQGLEKELGLDLSASILDENVKRAISMKIIKMVEAPLEEHLWYTYWLIIIRDTQFGAGLVGFKGKPDPEGSVEIGYGIDARVQRKGYMTEAVALLVEWALSQPACQRVTATTVQNPASNRVLEKLGFEQIGRDEEGLNWQMTRTGQ